MAISIISVAYGDYIKFVEPFVKACSEFSDDIYIASDRYSQHTFKSTFTKMGSMRNEAVDKCKNEYIVNLDIDDTLIALPDTEADFVGLGWIENEQEKTYWLPGEARTTKNTIRSNFMFKKSIKFTDKDNYTYDYIADLIKLGATFAKTRKPCVVYNRRTDSRSSKVTQQQLIKDKKQLAELERTVHEYRNRRHSL